MLHQPQPDPKEVRPRKLWFWIGGLVIVLGIAGGITTFVLGLSSVIGATSTDAEFEAGGQATFQAKETNDDSHAWKVYADRNVPSSDIARSCSATGPDGEVDLSNPGYNSQSTVNGETWVLVSNLDITEPGKYTIECAPDTNASELSVGYGPDGSSAALGIGGSVAALILIPLLGIIVGVTILVVTGVRRGKHRRRLQSELATPSGVHGYGQPAPGNYGPPPNMGPGQG